MCFSQILSMAIIIEYLHHHLTRAQWSQLSEVQNKCKYLKNENLLPVEMSPGHSVSEQSTYKLWINGYKYVDACQTAHF